MWRSLIRTGNGTWVNRKTLTIEWVVPIKGVLEEVKSKDYYSVTDELSPPCSMLQATSISMRRTLSVPEHSPSVTTSQNTACLVTNPQNSKHTANPTKVVRGANTLTKHVVTCWSFIWNSGKPSTETPACPDHSTISAGLVCPSWMLFSLEWLDLANAVNVASYEFAGRKFLSLVQAKGNTLVARGQSLAYGIFDVIPSVFLLLKTITLLIYILKREDFTLIFLKIIFPASWKCVVWQHRIHTLGGRLGRELPLDIMAVLGSFSSPTWLFPSLKFLTYSCSCF